MRYRKFGATGRDVPVVGQGTWNVPERGDAAEAARKSLITGIEEGMVHIDTAEMYGSGGAEELVAEAIAAIPRDKLFIVSKVLPQNASYKGTIKACEATLRRLQLHYLDCYLLHWRGNHPLSETMGALEELVDSGKIRSLGVSNFDLDDMLEAESLAGKHRIACNQILYNVFTRGPERGLIPHLQEQSIAMVAYTPFAQKSMNQLRSAGGGALKEIAQKHGTTEHAVLLAFAVRLDGCFTIPKASTPAHAVENAAAAELILDKDDLARLDAAFPPPSRDVPLAMI